MARRPRSGNLRASLLDRLTDDRPGQRSVEPDRGAADMESMRTSVLRDLSWLFNTGSFVPAEEIEEFEEVKRSVINYGVRELSGLSTSGLDAVALEKEIKRAIIDFEPRIVGQTLRVKVVTPDDDRTYATLAFEITGQMWADPAPIRIALHSDIDLDSGQVTVEDSDKRGR